ncbi:DUF4249 domain-containing protein [Aureisphaera galaxeae]|uniref:DUF4249 domain-containing protein n=1 Tax=Aureisphaera galaxeae TaxID=1538023 RepID=UPI0023508CC5|nr:DUF4249 domain-containing protein [Aureisphaera galaxeae]MDC8004749.1 DUF4249 domain-containing protein [Aureisphaera galaxeae]
MIRRIIKIYKAFVVLALLVSMGCVEEVSFNTQELESALVVEATITDETKPQQIRLSRTYRFEEDGPTPESGARVWMDSDDGMISFQESLEPGLYLSTSAYAASPNTNYELHIETNDGSSYQSRSTQMVTEVPIEDVYAVREASDFGDDGVSIYVDSFDPTGTADYYRYEYLETYKIIAPLWNSISMIASDNCDVQLGIREQEERICFNTVASTDVNLVNTSGLSESRVQRHLVRFLDADNYIISHRYSILLRQYAQSQEAFTYYRLLNELSESESLFSQNQPGFFEGNIRSATNQEEKVVGFFEVASVSERRLYFDYEDFFPNETLPPYPSGCTEIAPPQFTPAGTCGGLVTGIRNNEIRFLRENFSPNDVFPGPYYVVARACGDCTALGSNVVPDFWED